MVDDLRSSPNAELIKLTTDEVSDTMDERGEAELAWAQSSITSGRKSPVSRENISENSERGPGSN